MKQAPAGRSRFSPLIVIGSVVIGGGLFLLVILLVNWSRPTRPPVEVVTAALTLIPAPTYTPTQVKAEEEPTPTSAFPEGSSNGIFSVGAYVKVSGTGGAGLRLRTQPGLEAEPEFLGVEDEIFKIEAGPEEVDGYVWWYLVAPFEASTNGWAVANYLEIVQEP